MACCQFSEQQIGSIKHFPDALKPFIHPVFAVALALAGIFFIVKYDSGEKKDNGPTTGDGSNINAQGNVVIDRLIYATGSGSASDSSLTATMPVPIEKRQERASGPNLIAKYTDNRWTIFLGKVLNSLVWPLFRNNVISPDGDATNITTHLTYKHLESGGRI
jgi:hypothetical protein